METEASIISPRIRVATDEDVQRVAVHMREIDRIEATALTGMAPGPALRRQVRLTESRGSPYAGITSAGLAGCIFGVTRPSLTSDECMPWLVATDDLQRHGLDVLREAARTLPLLLGRSRRAAGWVHDRNRVAIRWLRWLGFEIGGEVRDFRGEPFRSYSMEARHVR